MSGCSARTSGWVVVLDDACRQLPAAPSVAHRGQLDDLVIPGPALKPDILACSIQKPHRWNNRIFQAARARRMRQIFYQSRTRVMGVLTPAQAAKSTRPNNVAATTAKINGTTLIIAVRPL